MASNEDHNATNNPALNGDPSTITQDFEKATRGMSHEEKNVAQHAARFGYGPLAHMRTDVNATLPGKYISVDDLNVDILKASTYTLCFQFQPSEVNSNPVSTGQLRIANSPTLLLWGSALSP